MSKAHRMVVLALAAVVMATAAVVRAEEEHASCKCKGEKVAITAAPEAVQKAIKEKAGEGTITCVTKATEDGKTVYEAKVKGTDGKVVMVQVSEDGTVVKTVPSEQICGGACEACKKKAVEETK